jgi:hypothetical protein
MPHKARQVGREVATPAAGAARSSLATMHGQLCSQDRCLRAALSQTDSYMTGPPSSHGRVCSHDLPRMTCRAVTTAAVL